MWNLKRHKGAVKEPQAGADSSFDLRRERYPKWNGIHTIDIGANAVIRDLRLEDVSQKLPGDPPLVKRDPSARAEVRGKAQ